MIEILECTLRDGSYPIAYQFTAEDTAVIAAGLEQAGFRRIEIGHGLGLGASRPDIGMAAATDEEYLAAAAGVLSEAKFGAFFIPGIGDESHLELAAKYGMNFVRIGTDVTETEKAERFIKRGKELGMEVSANPMKSYAVPLDEFVRRAVQLGEWGADIIAIVDSAGGMLPADVAETTRRLKENVGAAIGFHGHHNLQLAIANVLAAIEAGATIVDTSLRGLGRSSGNAQTEVLVMILEKLGMNPGIDVFKTMDLGDRLIAPIARGRGVDSVEITTGFAGFHSGFMKTLLTAAQRTGVDLRELIIEVSKVEQVKVTAQIAEEIAEKIAGANERKRPAAPERAVTIELPTRAAAGALDPGQRALEIAQEIYSLAAKSGKTSVFMIAATPRPHGAAATFPFVRSNPSCVIGNAEVSTLDDGLKIAAAVDGVVDVVLVDAEPGDGLCARVRELVRKSRVLTYRDSDALVQAADAVLAQLVPEIGATRVGICGASEAGWKLAIKLAQRGAAIVLFDPRAKVEDTARSLNTLLGRTAVVATRSATEAALESTVLVGTALREPIIDAAMIAALPVGSLVLDAGVGTIFPEALELGARRDLRMRRLDMRTGLTAEIANILETAELISTAMGRTELAGVPVVAGGLIGQRGEVVVDAIVAPTRVIGVADGRGHLLHGEDAAAFEPRVRTVREKIIGMRLH
jgi:4-hydroxy-2-oxovalerate aldolase